MKKKLQLLLLIVFCVCIHVCAKQNISVSGEIYDRLTTQYVLHSKVAVLNPDSTVVVEKEAYGEAYYNDGTRHQYGKYRFEIPKSANPYIIRVTKDGYDTYYQPLDISKLGSREFELRMDPIYLTPVKDNPSVELEEFVVKASKVKFYHKGDTIVYNADAFMLPEGSTLDALIAKLPGVEIREGGKIYVNGKYVESLLLNGKDFFKGNQDVLRQNLGAYAVKDIAVYDKYGHMSKLMDTKLEDDKEYVMDVRLKKDYMGGYMGNIEASYGTDDRYSGRLFAMHFNNNGRFTLYGNLNNVNNTNRPSERDGNASGGQPGISDISNGGFDYFVEDPRKTWNVNGDLDLTYTDKILLTNTFTESFLQRNSFRTALSDTRDKSLSLNTSHRFNMDKKLYYIHVRPEFRYNRSRTSASNASVEFDSDIQERYDIDRAVIDAIYTGSQHDLREAIINRNRFARKNRSNNYRGYLWSEQGFRFKGSPDAFNVWIEGEYSRDHSNSLTDQTIDYGFNGTDAPESSSAMRRENLGQPHYTAWLKGAARYYLKTGKSQLSLGYEYRHEQQRRSSEEFLFGTHTVDEEAYLPSDAPMTPDLGNTNSSKLYSNTHMIKGSFDYKTSLGQDVSFSFGVSPEFHIRRRNLFYNAFDMQDGGCQPLTIPVSRTSASFNNSSLRLDFGFPKNTSLRFNYKFKTDYAKLTDMIDIPNTVDPLNISHGNPHLKDAIRQSVMADLWINPNPQLLMIFHQDFDYASRDNVKGYTFDSSTGVRDFQTVNVSGNLASNTAVYVTKFLTVGDHAFNFTVQGYHEFWRYPTMIGEDGPMRKQVVFSNKTGYQAQVTYTLKSKYTFGAKFEGIELFSRRNSGGSANTAEHRYVPRVWTNLKLPFGLQFNCDMNYMIINGAEGTGIKPTQCLLNASLRYQLNDNWSFRLEGYDLLGQQKPYTNVVSATGRTQTVVNTLPRYGMLTVAYKFNTRKK